MNWSRLKPGAYLAIGLCSFWNFAYAQPNSQALLDASAKGSSAAVQSLLLQGTSPKVTDELGQTPLHRSAAHGHQSVAETLLSHGADINARDAAGKTPLDLAMAAGHDGLAAFLKSKGAATPQSPSTPAGPSKDSSPSESPTSTSRLLKPSLKFKTLREFEAEIREPACFLDSANVCFFAPTRKENEAKIVFPYLVKAYDSLFQIVGTHTDYKVVVYAFPKGNTNGWGGTSNCSIEYDDSLLNLAQQPEWTQYKVPHASGYIEEMAHNFVHATKTQFGWEMIGWSLGAEVSLKVAANPILAGQLRETRSGQQRTFTDYARNGHVFPIELPANQCDRVHAWLLDTCALRYGPRFWPDFFAQIRQQKKALTEAAQLGDADKIRNARYQITIECFDRLRGVQMKKLLQDNAISLTTDIKSLHPEAPGWNRRFQ